MKNKEYYKEKILKKDEDFCNNFIKKYILPNYYNLTCSSVGTCIQCHLISAMWLEEEYKKNKDSKYEKMQKEMIELLRNAKVDELVYVRDLISKDWQLRYFKGINEDSEYPFICFEDGKTSKTTNVTENWRYAKLYKRKFKIENYTGNEVMHCDTKEKFNIFCNYLNSLENNKERIIDEDVWYLCGEYFCYNFNKLLYSGIDYYKEKGYKILEFDDFDWE